MVSVRNCCTSYRTERGAGCRSLSAVAGSARARRNESSLRLTTNTPFDPAVPLSISATVKRLLHETTEAWRGRQETGGRHEPESRVVDRAGSAGGPVSLRWRHEADHSPRGARGDV